MHYIESLLHSLPISFIPLYKLIAIHQDNILSLLKYTGRIRHVLVLMSPDPSLLLQHASLSLWNSNRGVPSPPSDLFSDYHCCSEYKDKVPIRDTEVLSLSHRFQRYIPHGPTCSFLLIQCCGQSPHVPHFLVTPPSFSCL